jgi:hypothetical protein
VVETHHQQILAFTKMVVLAALEDLQVAVRVQALMALIG